MVFEDRLGAADRLVNRSERDQPRAYRQVLPEPGVLGQDWPAAGEKAGAAIAEPATGRLDVDVLRDPDLRRGLPHEPLVAGEGARRCLRVGQPPPVLLQLLDVGRIGGIDVEGQLERRLDPFRQREELAELVHAQAHHAIFVFDRVIRAPPAANAAEGRPRGVLRHGPALEADRRPDRNPIEPAGGHRAPRLADVAADGGEAVVVGKRVGQAQLAPDVREAGIDVEEQPLARGLQQVFLLEKAHDVDQNGGGGDRRLDLSATHPHGLASIQQQAIRPVETGGAHDLDEPADRGLLRAARRPPIFTQGHLVAQPVDQDRLVSDLGQPPGELQEGAGMAAVAGSLSNRGRHWNRCLQAAVEPSNGSNSAISASMRSPQISLWSHMLYSLGTRRASAT